MADLRLAAAAQSLLDAATAALDGETYAPPGGWAPMSLLPDVRRVQAGDNWASWDCEALVVHLTSVEWAQPAGGGPTPQTAPPVPHATALPIATFAVTVLMAVNVSADGVSEPDRDQRTAQTLRLLAAAGTLASGLAAARRDGSLLPDGCVAAGWGPAETVGPQGRWQGVRLPVRVELG